MKRWVCSLVVVVGLGCNSPQSPECARNTCSGCCTAAGECVLGQAETACGSSGAQCVDCSANGLVCGSGACKAAVADSGTDAGYDAGTDAGVPMIFVTLRWDITKELVGQCPNQYRATEECGVLKSMTKAAFDVLRPEYGACAITQESADGWTVDCTGKCWTQTQMCSTQAGGADYYTETYCPAPKYAAEAECAWAVP